MNLIPCPSLHFNERLRPVDMILIHYTDMKNTSEALAWLTNPLAQVSAHYLIGEEGQIYSLVDETKRAWHAGKSFWQGCTDINNCSIGIEMANPGHTYGYQPFFEAQIEALISLCLDIQVRWKIPSSRVLGHSDVAPQRKQDPGHLFPWDKLHQKGLGLWPSKDRTPCKDLMEGLSQIGYEITSPQHTLLAFQRHFQPHKITGIADEETLALVQGILDSQ